MIENAGSLEALLERRRNGADLVSPYAALHGSQGRTAWTLGEPQTGLGVQGALPPDPARPPREGCVSTPNRWSERPSDRVRIRETPCRPWRSEGRDRVFKRRRRDSNPQGRLSPPHFECGALPVRTTPPGTSGLVVLIGAVLPSNSRGARIRTGDLCDPNAALYRTEPRPEGQPMCVWVLAGYSAMEGRGLPPTVKRTGWDSNPRGRKPTRFPIVRLKPLGHPSLLGSCARTVPRTNAGLSRVPAQDYGGGGIRTHEGLSAQRLSRAPP